MAKAAAITVSDRCAAGERPDVSGPLLVQALREAGHEVTALVVPDGEESVAVALRSALESGARLVVTTGGTGVAPRDRTPEGTRLVIDRELPGVAELLRSSATRSSPHAALSRGLAGVVDAGPGRPGAFIVNLPGSPRAIEPGVATVLALVDHVLAQVTGADH